MSADSRGIRRRLSAALGAALFAGIGGGCLSLLESAFLAQRLPEVRPSFDPTLLKLAVMHAVGLAGLAGGAAFCLPRAGRALALSSVVMAASWILGHLAGWPTTWRLLLGAAFLAWLLPRRSGRGLRWTARTGVALALLSWVVPHDGGAAAGDRRAAGEGNVVLVVIDTLRADHLSAWGYEAPEAEDPRTSPALDRLAAAGTRFAQAYAQAPWTRPSAASYLTGLYPESHGIATQFDQLGPDTPTLAGFLGEQGFRRVGFSANPQVSYAFRLTRGFQSFWNPVQFLEGQTSLRALRRGPLFGWWDAWRAQRSASATTATPATPQRGLPDSDADSVNREVLAWARQAAPEPRTFLYIHYLDPHDPYNPPEDFLYGDPDAATALDESVLHAREPLPPRPLPGSVMEAATPEHRAALLRRYDSEIRYVDRRLAELLTELETLGHYVPTRDLLIITSDHGEEFYEHQQWLHGQSLFEEQLHVPLVLRGPGVAADTVHEAPVELVDLVPTIAAWIGAELPFPVHGRSLLDPAARDEPRLIYAHRPREQHPIDMIRIGDDKLMRIEVDADESSYLLYDLADDPLEQRERLQGDLPEETLGLLLEQARERARSLRGAGAQRGELDAAMRKSLEQLGYLQPDDG